MTTRPFLRGCVALLAFSLLSLVGCEPGEPDTAVPEEGSISAYLAEHPEENYSSDDVAAEEEEAEEAAETEE